MDILAKTSDGTYYEIGVNEQDGSSLSAGSVLGKRNRSESKMFLARRLNADSFKSIATKSLLDEYVNNSMLDPGIHMLPTAGFNLLKVLIFNLDFAI